MEFEELFGHKPPVFKLEAQTRWGAIGELIRGLVLQSKIEHDDEQAILEAVKKRELAMTTGIGGGIAIPHAMTNLIAEPIAGIGYSRSGIDFDAIDAQPVTLVCLYLIPQGQLQRRLHTLANLAKLLPSLQKRLLA